jgi:hypothetical protein
MLLWGYLESNQGPLLYQSKGIGQKGEMCRDDMGRKEPLSRDNGFGVQLGARVFHGVWRPLCAPSLPRRSHPVGC